MMKKLSLVFFLFCIFYLKVYAQSYTISSIGPGAGTAVSAAAFDPKDSNTMYVGGDCQGIMRSTDGGQSWIAPNRGLISPLEPFYEAYFVLDIDVDPINSNNVYIGTMRGIYKSQDKATSWSQLDINSVINDAQLGNHLPIGTIEVDPSDNNIIYAGFGDSYNHDTETAKGILLKSKDAGVSWSKIGMDTIPNNAIIYAIALDPNGSASSRRLVVSTDQGIFVSENAGQTFTSFDSGLAHNKGRRLVVSTPSSGNSTFYLVLFPNAPYDGGIYKWTVGTQRWESANGAADNEPLVVKDKTSCLYNALAVDPNNPDKIFIASAASYQESSQCETESFFASIDGGKSWQEIVQNMNSAWFAEVSIFPMLSISASNPSVLLGGYTGMTLSTDSGLNWQQVYAQVNSQSSKKLYKSNSRDIGSQMWTLALAIDPRPEKADTMYHGYADTLLFKTDDMAYFRRLSATAVNDPINDFADGWGNNSDANLTPQVSLDPDNADIVYASANFRLYKSLNGGDSWTEITGWENPYPESSSKRDNAARFAIDPNSALDSRTIYVTVYTGGLYKSIDGGKSWLNLSAKLPDSSSVSGVYIDPSNSNRIYLGTLSLIHYSKQSTDQLYTIYFSEDGGNSWQARGSLPASNKIWIDPLDGKHLLVATIDIQPDNNLGGLYQSNDGGLNWERVLSQPFVSDVISDPHVKDRIWALSTAYYQYDIGIDTPNMNAGLYKSTDRGKTWQREAIEFNHYSLFPIVAHPTRANEFYIGSAGLGVKKVVISEENKDTNPIPQIKATQTNDSVLLEISLSTGTMKDTAADWWFLANTPEGWFYLDLTTLSLAPLANDMNQIIPTYQGNIVDFDFIPILNLNNLSAGNFVFYFAIDTNMNAQLDFEQLFYDSATFEVNNK